LTEAGLKRGSWERNKINNTKRKVKKQGAPGDGHKCPQYWILHCPKEWRRVPPPGKEAAIKKKD
jgi:hypothetical protein